jgi:hypothetical protein
LFENKQRSFNQIFFLCLLKLITIFGKNAGIQAWKLAFPLVFESYQSPLLLNYIEPSRIGSALDDEPMRKLSLLLALDR